MDEAKLKQILENMDVPEADDNARKRALNLAMVEFKALEKEREHSSQGNSFFSRLMGMTTHKRRTSMYIKSNKKLMYGGMATAMAVVLIAGVTFTQLQQGPVGSTSQSDLQLIADSQSGSTTSTAQTAPTATAQAEVAQSAKPEQYQTPPYAPAERVEEARSDQTSTEQLAAASPPPMAMADSSAAGSAPAISSFNMKSIGNGVAKRKLSPHVMAESAQADMSRQAMGYAGAPVANTIIMPEPMPQPIYVDEDNDKFRDFAPSPVKLVAQEPVSTFSIDVDTVSYSFMRKQLNNGILPPQDAVRIEELVNYFDYNYALPESKTEPFKPTVTVLDSPWSKDKKLIHIGIKGYDVVPATRPHSNLVFLLDTSGSMNEPDKLPLLKNSLKMLLDTLTENDTVSIVVYAGSAGTVLEPTKATDKSKIVAAIDNLAAGGSTAGAQGIELAYQLAQQNFIKDGVNRVILATDGDFNVGASSDEDLKQIIEKKRESGIFLSVLGFGQGNLNDSLMQTLAQNGNGSAAYIDNLNEARKVLVEEASSTLFPIAKDVKIQVDFNPATVAEYRLVGYETRALNREDFNNDKVDAGDIGSGHAVTAIYEITPVGATPSVDPSRYAKSEIQAQPKNNFSDEYAFLKIRYKLPNENTSKLITTPISTKDFKEPCPVCPPNAMCEPCIGEASDDVEFSIAVAGFGQLLKGDTHVGNFTYDDVIKMAQENKGKDEFGNRAEFINLVRLAKSANPQ